MEYINMMNVPNYSAEVIIAVFQMCKCEDVPHHYLIGIIQYVWPRDIIADSNIVIVDTVPVIIGG